MKQYKKQCTNHTKRSKWK